MNTRTASRTEAPTTTRRKPFIERLSANVPPIGWQSAFVAQVIFMLKMWGELPRVPWGFVIFMWIGGIAIGLIGTALSDSDEEKDHG